MCKNCISTVYSLIRYEILGVKHGQWFWVGEFKLSRTSLEDKNRSGCPVVATAEIVETLTCEVPGLWWCRIHCCIGGRFWFIWLSLANALCTGLSWSSLLLYAILYLVLFLKYVSNWLFYLLFQMMYFKGIAAGKLPYIACADIIIYSLSTALVFHAVSLFQGLLQLHSLWLLLDPLHTP